MITGNPFRKIISYFQKRNYMVSDRFVHQLGQPIYTKWTIKKAVDEGYRINGWVYRAVSLIMKAASSVPWQVYNEETGEAIPEHHLTTLFRKPNPFISKKDLMELVIAWLQLTGNSYLKKVQVGGRTVELWPVSPDRIHPVPAKSIDEWLAGYALDDAHAPSFLPEEIVHHKFTNPANPHLGIAPLEAAGKAIDVDVDQQNWNKSAMQSRGVLDGVFTFERPFESQDDADAMSDRLNEKYAGGRKLGVIGSNAKYHRTGATPVELDFMTSRKFNREEIFIILGVPPQYAGSQETSTYNNYQTSELVLWFSTLIPLLEDIRDTFNFSFDDELGPNEQIRFDLSNVAAIRRALLDRAKTAEMLFKMGVPFEEVNRIFEFGVDEFEGWEKSHVAKAGAQEPKEPENRGNRFTLIEKRSADEEAIAREKEAVENVAPVFEKLLTDQKAEIFVDLEETGGMNVRPIIEGTRADWVEALKDVYLNTAVKFGAKIVLEKREAEKELRDVVDKYLEEEAIVLQELSLIQETTVMQIIEQVEDGLEKGLATATTQQAIIDAGIFSPVRSLRLARTITGTAASVGQWKSADLSGAKFKTWVNSGFEVRDEHIERGGETVPMDGRFSPKFGAVVGPLYPLDLNMPPGDRCNCRCSMTYSLKK